MFGGRGGKAHRGLMVWLMLRAKGGRLGSINRFQHRGRQERESGKKERCVEAEERENERTESPRGVPRSEGLAIESRPRESRQVTGRAHGVSPRVRRQENVRGCP